MHSLAVPATGAGRGAAGTYPAGAAPDYALRADRSHSGRPAPASYALAVDRSAPEGPTPPQYALAAGRKPGPPEALRRRWPYRAAAAALACHLAVLAAFILHPGAPRMLGEEDGLPDTLNVSVISAAELARLSPIPFQREAPPSPPPIPDSEFVPAPPPEPQPAPPPPEPPVQEAKATPEPPQEQPKTGEPREKTYDPSAFIEAASQQFSAQLNYAFKAAEQHRQTEQRQAVANRPKQAAPNVQVMRPGATHVGKSDEFERQVIWALGATVPMGNGKYGTSVVTFVVSAGGQVEDLKLLHSSGDDWLDKSCLMAVKQARMPTPPGGLPLGDRRFVIHYISMPFRTR